MNFPNVEIKKVTLWVAVPRGEGFSAGATVAYDTIGHLLEGYGEITIIDFKEEDAVVSFAPQKPRDGGQVAIEADEDRRIAAQEEAP